MNRRKAVEAALYVAVSVVVTALAVSNWRLRQRYEDTAVSLRARRPAVQQVQAGQRLEPFTARDRHGRVVTVGRNAAEPLLVVVDPSCGSCEKVLRELRETPRRDVAVIAVVPTLDSRPTLAIGNDTPVYTMSRAAAPPFVQHIGGVPRVIRMQPNGVVGAVCTSLKDCA